MTTYYYNGAQILAPLSIVSNTPTYEADTVSLKKLRASQGHQRWELSFNAMANDNAADLLLSSVENLAIADTMVMPQLKEVEEANTILGELLVTEITPANSGVVKINNTAATGGVLKKGSFIKFSNHDKVYVVSQDLSMQGFSGTVDLNIFPKLKKAMAADTEVKYGSECMITYFRKIENMQGIKFSDGILSDLGTIELVEAI